MTAPTPDRDALVHRLKRFVYYGNMNAPTMNLLSEAADALATVTAERDQARQMLADAEQKIASMDLDESLREEDERFADPL